jgi:hypothetical protein
LFDKRCHYSSRNVDYRSVRSDNAVDCYNYYYSDHDYFLLFHDYFLADKFDDARIDCNCNDFDYWIDRCYLTVDFEGNCASLIDCSHIVLALAYGY